MNSSSSLTFTQELIAEYLEECGALLQQRHRLTHSPLIEYAEQTKLDSKLWWLMAGLQKNRHIAVDEMGKRAWESYPGFAESASYLTSCIFCENSASIKNNLLHSESQFDIDIIKSVMEWSSPSFLSSFDEQSFLNSQLPSSICFGLWLCYFKHSDTLVDNLKTYIRHESEQVRDNVSCLTGLSQTKELLEPLLEIIPETGVNALWAACIVDPNNPKIKHTTHFMKRWDTACLLTPHLLYLSETQPEIAFLDYLKNTLDKHIYIYLLGFLGHIDTVPEIIEYFDDPKYSAVAGKAFTMITGLVPSESVSHLQEVPAESADVLGDLRVAMQEWRHYGKESAHEVWHSKQTEFEPKLRYRFGYHITDLLLQNRLHSANADLYERYHSAMEYTIFFSAPYHDPTQPVFRANQK